MHQAEQYLHESHLPADYHCHRLPLRVTVLSERKRCRIYDSPEFSQENASLLNCINEMVSTFQWSSDPIHALEMLTYAQTIKI